MMNRQEATKKIYEYYQQGYRYIVRDPDSKYLLLFDEKPKKYKKEEEFWGYKEPRRSQELPAKIVRNEDIQEINWNNRSATEIKGWLNC